MNQSTRQPLSTLSKFSRLFACFAVKVVLLILTLAILSFPSRAQTTWKINNINKIGGLKTEILGAPKVAKGAVEFDGVDDGIFVPVNLVEGLSAFTVEAIFRPDAGGGKEQRWLHIEGAAGAETRVMLETRLVGDQWFLDTFMKSGDNKLTHYAEKFMHPLGKWFRVAVVFDGREMRHYVDGNLELAGPMSLTKPFAKGTTSLGVRQNKIYWFKGAIKKVRVTPRALEPREFLKK